jgi:hypothetical protein
MSMKKPLYQRIFWYGALAGGLALGSVPLLTDAAAFGSLEILAGTILTIISLVYLRRPKRVRLPYRRTLS